MFHFKIIHNKNDLLIKMKFDNNIPSSTLKQLRGAVVKFQHVWRLMLTDDRSSMGQRSQFGNVIG